MKYKKSLIFICLVIFLFSMVSVTANELNDTLLNEKQNDDIIKINNQDQLGSSNIKENMLSTAEENETDSNPIITKLSTKITVKNIKGYENKKIKVTAIVKDQNNKMIKKGFVTFKFKGKTYEVKIKNGKAKKTIKIPKSNNRWKFNDYHKGKLTTVYGDKIYKGKVSFLEDSNYFASSSSFKVTSVKKTKTIKYTPTYMSEKTGKITHKKTVKTKKKTTTKKKSTGHTIKIGKYKGKISKSDYKALKSAKKYGYQCDVPFKCKNNKKMYMSVDYFPYSKYDPGNVYNLKKGFYGNVWYIKGPYTGDYVISDKYLGKSI